jgi:hypothetical protein
MELLTALSHLLARLLILLSLVLRNSQQYVPINSYLMDFGQIVKDGPDVVDVGL